MLISDLAAVPMQDFGIPLLQWQETPEYAAANGALVAQVEHLGEAERLTWKNLL